MKNQVFEYIVVYAPVDKDGNETEPAKIVKTGQLVSKSADKALVNIARQIPDEYAEKTDYVEIVIRPF